MKLRHVKNAAQAHLICDVLLNHAAKKSEQHITRDQDMTTIRDDSKNKIYIPTATGKLFHADNSFVRLLLGPIGSGKTTACCFELVKRACAMPAWDSGRRKSRFCIVRNTSGMLHTTSLNTWLQWFGNLGNIQKRQKPVLTYTHEFNDGAGIVEMEIIFLALDLPQDVSKLRSLELTGAFLNEVSELPQAVLAHMRGRVNRFPSKAFCEEQYWSGIWCDSNPSDTEHWMYKIFEESPAESHVLYKQPPGLIKNDDGKWSRNPLADNAENLPHDYYTRAAEGNNSDYVNVMCLGKWGTVSYGKVVYPEYNPDYHCIDDISPIQGAPLYLGIDFGLTPTCLVTQLSPRGRLMIFKEYCSDSMGLRTFVQSILLPGLARDFPYNREWKCYADPAGGARDPIMDELSCIGELQSLGVDAQAARTNDLDPRLASVRFFLNTMVDGKSAFALSKKGCPTLHKALARDYIYKKLAVAGEERYRDKPEKNFASHVVDCLQYVCLELSATTISNSQTKKYVDMFNPTFRF